MIDGAVDRLQARFDQCQNSMWEARRERDAATAEVTRLKTELADALAERDALLRVVAGLPSKTP